MNERPQYSHAASREAIIDIRLELPPEVTLESLAYLQDSVKTEYPQRQDLHVGAVVFNSETGPTSTSTQNGYVFVSEDGKQLFQARLDGFTFNRLAPYERWETFRDEAQRLWEIYSEALRPTQLIRVGHRMVNQLDIPGPSVELNDYLRTSPNPPGRLPKILNGYFLQMQVPLHDIGATLVLNEAFSQPQTQVDVIQVILDIDIFRERDVPHEKEALWQFLDMLHVYRNTVFEECITDKMRSLMQ